MKSLVIASGHFLEYILFGITERSRHSAAHIDINRDLPVANERRVNRRGQNLRKYLNVVA